MLELKFKDKAVGVIGDIHGSFQELFRLLKKVENSVIIIAGDCGVGFSDTKADKIKRFLSSSMTAFLEKRDIHLLLMRGNHDDPSYFNNELIRTDISTDRFILIPDYTYLEIGDINLLCIGGAVSVDRRFRKLDSSYWYDEEMIDMIKIPKMSMVGLDVLITHTMSREYISHKLPAMRDWLKISFQEDKKLALDCEREDLICKQLYEYYTPKLWYHGHYHLSHTTILEDTTIIGLNINELKEIKL
jgi:predicted phosphodiesterase